MSTIEQLKKATEEMWMKKMEQMLFRCNTGQRMFFYKVYPSGPSGQKEIENAINLIERTIRKNNLRNAEYVQNL